MVKKHNKALMNDAASLGKWKLLVWQAVTTIKIIIIIINSNKVEYVVSFKE